MSKKRIDDTAIGEDAFLDTIANLVGIIIILVVIVGSRSSATAKIAVAKEIESEVNQLESPLDKSKNLGQDLQKQYDELHGYNNEISFRDAERMAIMDRVTVAEKIVEEELGKIDQSARELIETEQEMSDLEKQLANLLQQQGDVQSIEKSTAILQHLPTPMAKTVFGRELHVMMRGGKVAVIPWDRLVDSLKIEARRSAERNSQKDRFVNQLGPIDGFLMTYGLKSQSGIMSNGSTTKLARTIELEKFELDPTNDVVYESVTETMGIGGRLRFELASSTAQHTTITVWVYPDSFNEFLASCLACTVPALPKDGSR